MIVTPVVIFLATFTVVFALGFQSLTVNQGHYKTAFLNSFLISAANLVILRYVPNAISNTELIAYMSGGPLGIISCMRFHSYIFKRKTTRQFNIQADNMVHTDSNKQLEEKIIKLRADNNCMREALISLGLDPDKLIKELQPGAGDLHSKLNALHSIRNILPADNEWIKKTRISDHWTIPK